MLDSILNNTTFPLLTAFLLGLLTMISPCPFCSDVTAISYLSKNISNSRAIFTNCLSYVLGKCFSYTLLALVFILGAQLDVVRDFFEDYGEPALGPFLIVIGVAIALFGWSESRHEHTTETEGAPDPALAEGQPAESHAHAHRHEHAPHRLITRLQTVNLAPLSGPVTSFILGAVFALAFCPYSGLLYFGTLIPLTMLQSMTWSWLMPVCFGLGDALPVIIIALLLSKGIAGIGKINGNLRHIETWLRRACVVIFIGMGLWMSISIFGGFHHHDHEGHHHEVEMIAPKGE